MNDVRELLAAAVSRLRAAGVESPEQDARLLLAHASGVELLRLPLLEGVDDDTAERFTALAARRADRVPLQHLTGRAYFRYNELVVGPGVFVPRPETEVMTGWAIEQLRPLVFGGRMPLVVDLCSGSGAVALSIASELTGTVVHAVEKSAAAAAYAKRNLADVPVYLHVEDMATALHEFDGRVDLVVANPPYIPLAEFASVPVEVRDHDPVEALFSGADGLDAIRVVAAAAQRLLRPGGMVALEHADVQGESVQRVLLDTEAFSAVRDHADLAGRPRFVTAVRHGRHPLRQD